MITFSIRSNLISVKKMRQNRRNQSIFRAISPDESLVRFRLEMHLGLEKAKVIPSEELREQSTTSKTVRASWLLAYNPSYNNDPLSSEAQLQGCHGTCSLFLLQSPVVLYEMRSFIKDPDAITGRKD